MRASATRPAGRSSPRSDHSLQHCRRRVSWVHRCDVTRLFRRLDVPSNRDRRSGLGVAACGLGVRTNRTSAVEMTGTGTPFTTVGAYTHCRAAAIAALSRRARTACGAGPSGDAAVDWTMCTSCTRPLVLIVTSMRTSPCTPAAWASEGYWGGTSRILRGTGTFPPGRRDRPGARI